MSELVSAMLNRERDRDCSDSKSGEDAEDQFRHVRQLDGHAYARSGPKFLEIGGQVVDGMVDLGPGQTKRFAVETIVAVGCICESEFIRSL